MIQKTLVLIKPDGVKRALIGELISRFERVGLKIIGMKMVLVDSEFSKQHYSAHIEKGFYPNLEKYITLGPVIAMVLEGIEAVELVRKMIGSTEPKKALPGTIRGDYAHHTYAYTDANSKAAMNLIHASEDVEQAENEIALWFAPEQLHDYKRSDDDFVL